MVIGRLIDTAIGAVSPRLGAQRLRWRAEMSGGVSGYQAAKRELAALRRWAVRPRTADEDALPGLPEQRARSRDMLMNAPIAAGAVRTVVTNVVGTGLRLSAQASRHALRRAGLAEGQIEEIEQDLEHEWRLFCRREHADAHLRLNFKQQQELAFRTVLASGDAFVAVVAARAGSPFDFTLQLIEADRVCNPSQQPNSNTLADGIEYDASGAPVACHVAELPRTGTGPREWRRLPLRGEDGSPRVLHLMHGDRIDQSRGVPYLAPVIATLKELDRYTQAEITAAVLNACIAILGESPAGASPLKQAASGSDSVGAGGLRQADIAFEPGMVLEGFVPGETLKPFSGDRPNSGFDPFVLAVLRQVGVALELPYELLIKHFTASYSAARAALLQAGGFFRARRAWLVEGMCQPIYEMVIENAVLRGRINPPGFLTDPMLRLAWVGARWTGPSFGQIDPYKEVMAAEKRLALTLSSLSRETAELTGEDWEDVAAERASEAATQGRFGVAPAEAREPEVMPAAPDDDGPEREAASDLEDEALIERRRVA